MRVENWESLKFNDVLACRDCGRSGPHYCTGKPMPDLFGSKIEIDPSLPPDGWYLKTSRPVDFVEIGSE